MGIEYNRKAHEKVIEDLKEVSDAIEHGIGHEDVGQGELAGRKEKLSEQDQALYEKAHAEALKENQERMK